MNLLKHLAESSKHPKINKRLDSTVASVKEALGVDELSDALSTAINDVLTQYGGQGSADDQTLQVVDFVNSSGQRPASQKEFNAIASDYREEKESEGVVYSNAEWKKLVTDAFATFSPQPTTDDAFRVEPDEGGEFDGEFGLDGDEFSDEFSDELSSDDFANALDDSDGFSQSAQDVYGNEENEEKWPSDETDFLRQISLRPRRREENEEAQRGWGDGWRGVKRRSSDLKYASSYNDAERTKAPKVRTSQEEEERDQQLRQPIKQSVLKAASSRFNKRSQENEEQENDLTNLVTTKRELTKQANQKAKEFEDEGAAAFKKFHQQHNQAPYCQQTQSEECTAWLRGWKKAAKEYYADEQPTNAKRKKK